MLKDFLQKTFLIKYFIRLSWIKGKRRYRNKDGNQRNKQENLSRLSKTLGKCAKINDAHLALNSLKNLKCYPLQNNLVSNLCSVLHNLTNYNFNYILYNILQIHLYLKNILLLLTNFI